MRKEPNMYANVRSDNIHVTGEEKFVSKNVEINGNASSSFSRAVLLSRLTQNSSLVLALFQLFSSL